MSDFDLDPFAAAAAAAASAVGGEAGAADAPVAAATAVPAPHWACYLDDGWKRYPDDISIHLERNYQLGNKDVAVSMHGGAYVINLSQNTQTNMSTHFKRFVRRDFDGHLPPSMKWYWQGDDKWVAIDPITSYQLSTYPATRPRVLIPMGDFYCSYQGTYEMDLNTTAEQVNKESKKRRRMVRAPNSKEAVRVAAEEDRQRALKGLPPLPTPAPSPPKPTHSSLFGFGAGAAAATATAADIGEEVPMDEDDPAVAAAAAAAASADPSDLLATAGIVYKHMEDCKDRECPICLDALDATETGPLLSIILPKCHEHGFHLKCASECISASSLKCPICAKVYGAPVTGNQPKDGKMRTRVIANKLPGFTCKTIQISYEFPDGVQGPEHPHPGEDYEGTERMAFLPDNEEGRAILELLKVAWKRRLIFAVGTSVTFGPEAGVRVVWNGIHHKTELTGTYGFPDPSYFTRVREELARLGVQDDKAE